MNLRITNCNNFFKIKGTLNKKNVSEFKSEFENIFDRVNTLTISVEGIESMDRHGVNAIVELHNLSITQNKSLAIIGYGSEALYDYFKSTQVAA